MRFLAEDFQPRYRSLNFLGAALALAALAFIVGHPGPQTACLLCGLVRLLLLGTGIVFFLALAQNPGPLGQRIYASLVLPLSLLGLLMAGRLWWLQNQGPSVDCARWFDAPTSWQTYVLDVFAGKEGAWQALAEAVTQALSHYCASGQWQWQGISLAELGLVLFAVLSLIALRQWRKRPRSVFT